MINWSTNWLASLVKVILQVLFKYVISVNDIFTGFKSQ